MVTIKLTVSMVTGATEQQPTDKMLRVQAAQSLKNIDYNYYAKLAHYLKIWQTSDRCSSVISQDFGLFQ